MASYVHFMETYIIMAIRLTTYHHADEVPVLPGTNLFHSVELFQILERATGFAPRMIVAFEWEKPVGKLLVSTRQILSWTDVYQKAMIYGTGEYFNTSRKPDEIFAEILPYLSAQLADKVFMIEFRNLEEPLFGYRYFRENRFFPVRWLRVQNSIHHEVIDKWMSAKRRKHIQQGLENGVVLGVVESEEELRVFFRMLKHFYQSKFSRFMPDMNFFESLFKYKTDKHLSEIFTVKYKGKIIGGAVCFFSDSTAYLVMAGGLRKSYPMLYPNVLAVWNAMTYAREHGYRHFEFMNAGLPFKKFGYRDFILRFGGKQFGTRRWFRLRWEWLNKLLVKFYV